MGKHISIFANNKGADQPVHPHSLISNIVIRLLESTISRLTTSKISIFWLVSVAEQAGFETHLVGNSQDRFYCLTAHTIVHV